MKVNGKTITWTEQESTLGKMEGSTKVNIRETKSMGMESIFGQMEGAILAIGVQENNMDLEDITSHQKTKKNTDFGKTEEESNGLTRIL